MQSNNSQNDSNVRIMMSVNDSQTVFSSIKKSTRGVNTTWNESFYFFISSVEADTLTVKLQQDDRDELASSLGSAEISILQQFSQDELDIVKTFDLTSSTPGFIPKITVNLILRVILLLLFVYFILYFKKCFFSFC